MSEANNTGAADFSGQTNEDFQDNWQKFLSHDFGDEEPAGNESQTGSESTAGAASDAGTAQDSISGGQGADTLTGAESQSASGQPNVEGTTGKDDLGGNAAEPTVSEELIAAVLGLGDMPKPDSSPGGQPPAASSPEPAADASGEDQPFMPFKPTFKLDPQLCAAIFESEDPQVRHDALVNLLSAFGNAITASVDARVKEHWQPAIQTSFASAQQERMVAQAIDQDFYGTFPELRPYKKAVTKAFEVIANQGGAAGGYSEEVRNRVGNLARMSLERSGIKFAAKNVASPQQQQQQDAPKPPAQGHFEAGSSRQNISGQDNGPAELFDQLSQWA